MTTMVVTGGAGFIGSNFIHQMIKSHPDNRIVCLDALTYAGNINNLKDILQNRNFRFAKVNITDRVAVSKLFKEELPDVVVNFAAESHVDRSIKDPHIFLETNIVGTSVLMDESMKINVKRYHQVSTDEVYGDLPLNRPDLAFDENYPLHTSSPYSASKAGADLLAMAYRRTYGFPVTISRCSNNYGPRQFPEKLIPIIISKALNNEKMPIYGDGLNVRDWLHVNDHCSAIDLILQKGKEGEVYNIGGHGERNNITIVKTVLSILGKPDSLITFVADRKGHDRRYAMNSSKITKELGWTPKYEVEKGLRETVEWYVNNKKWSDDIVNGNYLLENEKVK